MSTNTQNFEGAHDFVINHPQFIENQAIHNTVPGETGSGLKSLLEACNPDAFHDSSARHPPPRCHPGTRGAFIGKISAWGLCTSGQEECILWMHGPAGVGKSAVAQSCADLLAENDKLGATFFFSRPNRRDNSNHFFTSISYQIAMSHEPYGRIIDLKLRKDPTLLKKSITQQFQELLVKPIQELRAQGEDLERRVVIIDGLDECAEHRAQQEIVQIVAASIRNNTTPFLWAFFSRPETHIIASFTSDDIVPLSHHIELPVSRAIDHEILCYLTDELKKIQKERNLPSSWPPEQQIGILVDLSGGLFIYAATVIRFIGDPNSLGPDTQLAAVLSLATIAKENADSEHPLIELDLFYMLILLSIPPKILPVILNILLLNSLGLGVLKSANILGLSQTQYLGVCGILQSVFRVEPARRPDWGYNFNWCRQDLFSDDEMEIVFYHASFMEFMQNIKRSKDLTLGLYTFAQCSCWSGIALWTP
ncbi:hypothetical protein P691DRAFT_788061 [Macrolepiota fuliginosa MF-IS2]|uniref:Nephrocystin 3-like N-terminal domain-containing protein n=1 Tax=Macrolepiota fuliginosa MF-IS2 TaxID=1400762 RepID=A0A9P6BXT0_9AGAR|nr:hypothetical protein P691DRAFT_788061 [Macrolepiota fuliginosa MF-IS2]